MVVQWEDNVAVESNAIYQSGVLLASNSGDTSVLTGLFFDDLALSSYQITAVDINDNDAEDETLLTIDIPNLEITQIDEVP